MTDTSLTLTPLAPRYPPGYATSHHISSNSKLHFRNPWPSTHQKAGLLKILHARWFSSTKNFVPVPPLHDSANSQTFIPGIEKPYFCSPSFESKSPSSGDSSKTEGSVQTGGHEEGLGEGLKATWIGHASFLIQTGNGVNILFDPVWSNKVGPYGLVGPERFTPPPCTIDQLPNIDIIAISHDHYDHLDSPTLKRILEKQAGRVRFVVGLGLKSVLLGLGIGIVEEQVVELDWWERVRVEKEKRERSVELVCTPAMHNSGRKAWGFGSTLWCSWVLVEHSASRPQSQSSKMELVSGNSSNASSLAKDAKSKSLYFAGDTGYCYVPTDDQISHHSAPHAPCPAFSEIGDLYGPFDLALLPIGCFRPRSIMSGVHCSPYDAVAIHKAVRSKKSIAMHYGTFRGSISAHYEPVTDPLEVWKKAVEDEGLEWGVEVGVCAIGGTVVV